MWIWSMNWISELGPLPSLCQLSCQPHPYHLGVLVLLLVRVKAAASMDKHPACPSGLGVKVENVLFLAQ